MTRKKLPAYGAALMKTRRTGEHPVCIHLIYGRDWRSACVCEWPQLEGLHAMLALKPEEYEPERYDFSVVTGLNVSVFDLHGAAAEVNEADADHPTAWGFGKFYALLGELGHFSAGIDVQSPRVFGEHWYYSDHIACAARDCRYLHDPSHNHGWPLWWSSELEEKNAKRRFTWLANVHQSIERRFAECE